MYDMCIAYADIDLRLLAEQEAALPSVALLEAIVT